jgi:hypothetical protein
LPAKGPCSSRARADGEGEVAPGGRFVSLSPANKRSLLAGRLNRRSVVSGNIFNSRGIHVGVVNGQEIFDLRGRKLYNLKGTNIYRLSGELVGHLSAAKGTDKRLDRATDRLFSGNGSS